MTFMKLTCLRSAFFNRLLEEIMKMVLLGVVLWAGVTFGNSITPYPLNLIVTTDIIHPPPMYDFPFPSAEMLSRLPPVTASHINDSINFSKRSVAMMETLEVNLQGADITPELGSTAHGLLINGYPSNDAMHYEKSSMIITKASQNLMYTRCQRFILNTDECAGFISTLNLRETEYAGECASLQRLACSTSKISSRYRTFDGSCNNPVRSSWGQALTGYKRLLHPKYTDSIQEPRRAISRHPLPSARLLSTQLASNLDRPNDKKSIALSVWSQFVYNDMVHTPIRKAIHTNHPIRCCSTAGHFLAPRYAHPSCMPISVPPDASVPELFRFDTCMEYTRSATTFRGDCTFGAIEQMNQASHFMDGSHIYGSNSHDAAALRDNTGGLLKTTNIEGEDFPAMVANARSKCFVNNDSSTCFSTGDVRANVNPWLASLHTLWVREHNRIARAIAAYNPGWNSNKVYQEVRRIVVAQLQHITYKHWLPAVTGKMFDDLYESYDTGYNSDVNPTITNSFATAGFHFINSLLDQDIEMVDDADNVTSQRLNNHYFKPEIVTKKGGLKQILRGMVNQMSQDSDLNYDDDLRQNWLGGLDVLAVDIQRGRDHGLPGYTQFRVLCNLPAASTFSELTHIPQQIVEKLSKAYEHPGDIDLVVGAMAEERLPGSLLGPTFTCLIKEQLWRSRVGDRFFYTHSDESGSFSKKQLAEIKRTSLARLLCDNAGVESVQKDVFQPPSDSNPVVTCEEIKKMNLGVWQDYDLQSENILSRTKKWIKTKVASSNIRNYTK